jgi:hypothetical protein
MSYEIRYEDDVRLQDVTSPSATFLCRDRTQHFGESCLPGAALWLIVVVAVSISRLTGPSLFWQTTRTLYLSDRLLAMAGDATALSSPPPDQPALEHVSHAETSSTSTVMQSLGSVSEPPESGRTTATGMLVSASGIPVHFSGGRFSGQIIKTRLFELQKVPLLARN